MSQRHTFVHRRALTLAVLVLASGGIAAAAPECQIQTPVEGRKVVEGTVTNTTPAWELKINGGAAIKVMVMADKTFVQPLGAALAAGQKVTLTDPAASGAAEGCEAVVEPDCTINAPFEGATQVQGTLPASTGKVLLRVLSPSGGVVQSPAAALEDSNQRFTAAVSALSSGQTVRVMAFKTDGTGLASCEAPVPTSKLDWGLVRAAFTGGVIYSKEREDFSQSDGYVAFNVEKTWARHGRWGLNQYIDVRLTSLPQNVETVPPPEQGMEAGGSGGMGEAGSGGVGEGGPGAMGMMTNNATEQTPDATSQFLASRKAAVIQAGIYLPYQVNRWTDNALFVAPLIKAGFQTPTSGNELSDVDSASGQQGATPVGDDVSNFFGFGGRIGHQKLAATPDKAHELISYLDFVWGRWENFELKEPIDPTGSVWRHRPSRLGIEGRLMIPGTPVQIGFDANLGKGDDDVRFIFGTRFDIAKILGKLRLP